MKERAEEEIGARAVVRYFKKLNGTGFEGLVIMSSDTNVSPVIYLKGYYSMYLEIMDEEAAIDSIWKDIKKCYFDNLPVSSFDVEGFFDYEKIRSNLGLRLVNYKSNEEWLRDISHIRFLDFAIVFTVRVMEERNAEATITVHRVHQYKWKKSNEEMLHDAIENMKYDYEIISIRQILEENKGNLGMDDEDMEELSNDVPMFILSNRLRNYGASSILCPDALKDFASMCGCDKVAMLPSSVHEWILVPFSEELDCDCLKHIVEEINESVLSSEEKLSNNVYIYDSKIDKITM
jgi:hypothetical protein